METIVLNKKTKKILWKRILITFIVVAATAVCVFLTGNLRTEYKYYSISPERDTVVLGISANKFLVSEATLERLETAKEENHYQIADYNMDTIIERKWIITWKNTKNDDEVIKSAIADSIYIIVYALELDIDGETYILPEYKGYQVLEELKEINKDLDITLLKGVYVNENEVLDQAEIDTLLSNYKAQFKK